MGSVIHFAPLTGAQHAWLEQRIAWMVDNQVRWGEPRDTADTDTRDWFAADIGSGKRTWGQATAYARGPHWCPGYYDCLECYGD